MKTVLGIEAMVLALGAGVFPGLAVEHVRHEADRPLPARQWDVVDVTFKAADVPDQPVDVTFTAVFNSAAGKQLDVPGFYNGGREYVLRFTPPSAGTWNYTTHSSIPELDGLKGSLSAQAPRPGRKGAVTIDPAAPRAFRYEDGDTYYAIAFEADWLFALDAENASDIPLTRKLVDSLAGYGFNQVVMNVFAYDVSWKKDDRLTAEHDYGSPTLFPFGGSNEQPDYARLNTDYFKRLDRVISYLDQKGVAAHLMIYVWNKLVNWPDASSEADNRYFDYVVKRYQAFPNLIWDISKEALGYGHNDVDYISQRIDRKSPYVVFPGCYTSPEVCLERAYQCVFAGTFPTHYWQGSAWNVVIPDIEALAPEARPKLDYYRHMRTFVEKYDLSGLTPGRQRSNSGFCLDNGEDLFIYYVPKENVSIGLRIPEDKRGRTMTGTWFDPFTGTFGAPIRKEVAQWGGFPKPEGDRFAMLVVEIGPEK